MRFERIGNYLRSWDIFGHKVTVNHKGEDSYKTMLGFIISATVFGLIVSNFVTLSVGFMDGSRQEEKSNSQLYDRHNSPVYNLTESGIRVAIYAHK